MARESDNGPPKSLGSKRDEPGMRSIDRAIHHIQPLLFMYDMRWVSFVEDEQSSFFESLDHPRHWNPSPQGQISTQKQKPAMSSLVLYHTEMDSSAEKRSTKSRRHMPAFTPQLHSMTGCRMVMYAQYRSRHPQAPETPDGITDRLEHRGVLGCFLNTPTVKRRRHVRVLPKQLASRELVVMWMQKKETARVTLRNTI